MLVGVQCKVPGEGAEGRVNAVAGVDTGLAHLAALESLMS